MEPNEYGVYLMDAGTSFELDESGSNVRIQVVEVEPGAFISGYDFSYRCGNWSSCAGLPHVTSERFGRFEDAVHFQREHALRHFDPSRLTDSCATPEQRKLAAKITKQIQEGWPLASGLSNAQMSLF